MARVETSAGISVERFFQFSLLGMVASGYLAVAGSGYLDTATIVLAGAGLFLRALHIAGTFALDLSDRAATKLAASYIAFFAIDYFLLSRDFLAATVHLVFFLAVMKILTAKSNRDYLYTAAIAFLELLAAAILSVNLNFFIFLALYLLFAIAALASAEIRRSLLRAPATAQGGLRHFHLRLALLMGSVTIGILTLTAALFFLLPRTAEAALSRFISHRIFLPGFSDQVTLGEIGEIKTTSRPVMHIAIYSREVPRGLKWRGAALTDFDGKRWSNPASPEERMSIENGLVKLPDTQIRAGKGLNYHVDLNAVTTTALFFAGAPEKLQVRQPFEVYRNETGGYRLSHLPPQGFSYDAYSLLEEPPEITPAADPLTMMSPALRQRYIQLPARLDQRIPKLAHVITAGAATDLERARALERRLRSDYGYTLDLPSREIADPLAYFLFTRKKGYCEYFASAMAIMLRTLDIPARLATGFQTGVYNPLSDLWLVRASDAHTWVEAWIPGHGWTTFDPTPPDPNPAGLALLTRLTLYVDAAQTFWQEWVVTYDLGRQGALSYHMEMGARRLGIRWSDSFSDLQANWKAFLAGARRYGIRAAMVLVFAVFCWIAVPPVFRLARTRLRVRRVRRGQVAAGDATLLYHRMLHLLKHHGYQKPAWFTPAEFAASLGPPNLREAVAEFTMTYNQWRFGGHTELASRLSRLLDELERQKL